MERDLVDRLRAMAGPIKPNVCTEAADEIERLTREREAFKAQADDVVEVDCADMEARIAFARAERRDSIRLSARDIWRMASDRRGRNEPDEEWDDD